MTIGNLLSNILQFLNNLLEIINGPITTCVFNYTAGTLNLTGKGERAA